VTVTLQFWQLVTLLLAFFGFVGAITKVLLNQIDKRLDTKFTAMEAASKAGDSSIKDILTQHIADEAKNSGQLMELERQLLQWKADLPLQYVRREDFIRNQTTIEAKLDGLALKMETAQIDRRNHA